MQSRPLVLAGALLLTGPVLPASAQDLPFEVTEKKNRLRCDHYERNRQPFFGTTHLHTGLSFDASIRFVDFKVNNPRLAYKFAKRESHIQLPNPQGWQLGPKDPMSFPIIDRPLDWGAVTDHSEHFGEMGICKDLMGDIPERMAMECRMINGFFYNPGIPPKLNAPNPSLGRTIASNAFTNLTLTSLGAISRNAQLPVCTANPELCTRSEMRVWEEVRHAAEEEYDRSSDCKFTTFVAYENTSTPLLNNWHRNVIFRNDRVVKQPVNAIDMAVRVNEDPTKVPVDTLLARVPEDPRVWPVPPGIVVDHPLPQPFWNKLQWDCWDGKNVTPGLATRCDFITIPHNSNLGGGIPGVFPPLFMDPYNTADAKRHAEMEPLVEIYQDKGSSECRYDPRYLAGTDTIDEFCAFEILDGKTLGSASGVGTSGSGGSSAPDTFGPRAYVRNVWKDGIKYAANREFEGVNPFKMGVVAASDSHTGVMGWHPENEKWPGHLGIDDIFPVQRASTIQNSSGGHSVVWAEENSRDSIFEALKRKETYGTSGPRMVVRFFGGFDFKADACERDFVEIGYRDGVPMGGDLSRADDKTKKPRFIAAAWRDDFLRTNLEQIQIIKGWVSRERDPETGEWSYEEHEKVYTAVGDTGSPFNPAVDPETCKADPSVGYERLCTVWEDPDFHPEQHAFYYARVLEEPVCRYSTLWCRVHIGVDPLDHDQCVSDLASMAAGEVDKDELARARELLEALWSGKASEEQTQQMRDLLEDLLFVREAEITEAKDLLEGLLSGETDVPRDESAKARVGKILVEVLGALAKVRANHGAMCCSDQTTEPFVQPIIQERAWTSPIWYEPGR